MNSREIIRRAWEHAPADSPDFGLFIMDTKFTEKLGHWLTLPEEKRDYEVGAKLLLQLSGNKIMYKNIMGNLQGRRAFLEYQLKKYYNFRLQKLTHDEVKVMEIEVEKIVENNISLAEKADKSPKGKRQDHDSLPDDIKAKYVENLDLLHRMRELHLRLRTMSLDNATCPDSERYPFLKELIELDKKLHKNWEDYDHYVIPTPKATPSDIDKKSSSKKTKSADSTKKSTGKAASTKKMTAKKESSV